MKILNNLARLIFPGIVLFTAYIPISSAQVSTPVLEFSLSTHQLNTELNFSGNSYTTKTSQLGIHWYEPFTPSFHGGLEFGYMEMTQLDNPLASARFTAGEYVGLLLRYIPLRTEHLTLSLNFNYRYNQASGSTSGQNTEFTWNEMSYNARLNYQLTQLVGLHFAAEQFYINGVQRDSGTVDKITDFAEKKPESAIIGINLTSDRSGVIAIEQIIGSQRGIRLYFMRKF